MTISDCIQVVSNNPNPLIIYMITVPAIAFILSMFFDQTGHESPGKYLFSGTIYATAIPGVFAIVLSGYDILFNGTDLKDVNMVVYFLPILSMVASIAIINRVVDMKRIPGFKRLSGLLLMIAVTCILVFILDKLFIGVLFFGSVYTFLGIFVVLFVVVKIGWEKAFG